MFSETILLCDREVTFETGELARQAGGSVLVTMGETVLLATATAAAKPAELDGTPLMVEYRQRISAAGRIPGSYHRREGPATELDTLTSRLIDRSIRPLFPSGWRHDTQVIVSPLSYDPDTDPEVLAITAAAAALALSPIPWGGPVAAVRVGRRGGELTGFAPPAEMERSDLDLVVVTSPEGIVMIEGGADEVAEADVLRALELAEHLTSPLHELIGRMREAVGRPKAALPAAASDPALLERARALAAPRYADALSVADKQERGLALQAADRALLGELAAAAGGEPGPAPERLRAALEQVKKEVVRGWVAEGRRIDGRAPRDIRPISGRVGWLPRCHGSAVFTRGETQAVVTCTLGTDRDAQSIETMGGALRQRFLLHYSFPPYSVGEVKPMRGPGRREVGHGRLARRALEPVLPGNHSHTIRIESLITESNGSSSMATVCGGTMALRDAGVQIKRPVAGIAMGLLRHGERYVVLSDIMGDEDHLGDMDFKVTGTEEGITAIQLDNKLGSLPAAVMAEALEQAREGRLAILEAMAAIQAETRRELSEHVPRSAVMRIERNRIRDLIGQGGKTIKGVQEATGASIDVNSDDGVVKIYARGGDAIEAARARVEELTAIPRLGATYPAKVVAQKPFGAFVRIFQGIEGLLPDADLGEGAEVRIEVAGVNDKGKLILRRAREQP